MSNFLLAITVEDLREFIEAVKDFYIEFGVGAAVGLPFIETLFPFLPLFLMLALNMLTYGAFMGYIYTYIGTVSGTIIIFVFMRYLSLGRLKGRRKKRPSVHRYLEWIENTHPILHILVLMVPFSPTFMINYSMGLSKMRFTTFLIITFVSRAIMLVICMPLGGTLLNLYRTGRFGGVEIMWLTVMGLTILAGTIGGQIINRRILTSKNGE